MTGPLQGRAGRRRFVQGVTASALWPAAIGSGCGASSDLDTGGPMAWVSAQGSEEGQFGVAASTAPFESVSRIVTGFRGHDVAQHPERLLHFAMFGRRPSTRSAIVDIDAGRVELIFEAAPGRAFQGHGFFTVDGRYLVTSEADTFTGAGALGIRETERYSLIGELETYGIGPHEVQLMPDHRTVVVANGGLLTRPETGREVLNLDTMDSTLSYVDLESGALLEQRRVPDPKSSIRHLDVADDGTVAFGVQVQREALDHDRPVPLGGMHRLGREIELFMVGEERMRLLNDYVGSVAVAAT